MTRAERILVVVFGFLLFLTGLGYMILHDNGKPSTHIEQQVAR